MYAWGLCNQSQWIFLSSGSWLTWRRGSWDCNGCLHQSTGRRASFSSWEQRTCLGGYSDPKCWAELAQTQSRVQVCVPPHKPFFIPLASCLPSISPLPISSWVSNSFSTSFCTKAQVFLITWWLRQAKLLTFFSPLCKILVSCPVAQDNPKAGGGGVAQQSHLCNSCSQHWLYWETEALTLQLNVHFLEKCLLSTGILTFWRRPRKFWHKHLGLFESYFKFKIWHNQIPEGMGLFWFPSQFSQNLTLPRITLL